jgi:hypothetical protein
VKNKSTAFTKVKIRNWKRFNPRQDIQKPGWFRVDYLLLEDPAFYDFTHEEFHAFMYILAQACRKNSSEVLINYAHARITARLSKVGIDSAIQKLLEIEVLENPPNECVREPSVDVTHKPVDVTHTNADVTRTYGILPDVTRRDVTGRDETKEKYIAESKKSDSAVQVIDPEYRPTGMGPPRESEKQLRRPKFDFRALYAKYPRKEGKDRGLKQCEIQIKTQDEYDALSRAIDKYAALCLKNGTIKKHFSSFMGSERTGKPWRDYLDVDAGEGSQQEQPKKTSAADLTAFLRSRGDA